MIQREISYIYVFFLVPFKKICCQKSSQHDTRKLSFSTTLLYCVDSSTVLLLCILSSSQLATLASCRIFCFLSSILLPSLSTSIPCSSVFYCRLMCACERVCGVRVHTLTLSRYSRYFVQVGMYQLVVPFNPVFETFLSHIVELAV